MRYVRAASSVAFVAAAWAAAAAVPLPAAARALAGLVAVLVLPGLALDRALGTGAPAGTGSEASAAELPARALVLSIALAGVAGAASSLLGFSIAAVHGALLACTLAAAIAASRSAKVACGAADEMSRDAAAGGRDRPGAGAPQPPAARRPPAGAAHPWEGVAVAGLATLTAAATVLAAAAPNIARDRMWYAAYVTRLASGEAMVWTEPVLATGRVVWRFAHNAWLVSLGAWSALSDVGAPVLLERVAPPLLVLFAASAAFALARALLRDRSRATVVALASLVVLLASRFPYFAPERTAFFARLVEDKTIALVVLVPVALALCIDAMSARERIGPRAWARIGLALLATALTHALVYLIACITLGAFAVATLVLQRPALQTRGPRAVRSTEAAGDGSASGRRVIAVIALAALIATLPAGVGTRARSDVFATARDLAASVDAATDPVVRAHLRMQRLRTIATGGPIVEPGLLADPVLLAALAGLAPALAAARTPWGSFLLATTATFLALAFAPFVAPAFGRIVVPWMAYRALWGVPFGLLLGALASAVWPAGPTSASGAAAPGSRPRTPGDVRGPPRAHALAPPRWRRTAGAAVVLGLTMLGMGALPWGRLRAPGAGHAQRLQPDAATLALLHRLRSLRADALVAAAPGLAELVPAHAGRAVLALADRPTVVFAGSRAVAEDRLRASALLVALPLARTELREATAARHRVSHVVRERRDCAGGERETFAVDRYVVCEPGGGSRGEDRGSAAAGTAGAADTSTSAPPGPSDTLARLGDALACRPAPDASRTSFGWRRTGRWSGAYVSVECTARFSPPVRVASIAVSAHLPRAREALVHRVEVLDGRGRVCALAEGTVDLAGDAAAHVAAPCARAAEVRVQLVPAFLPYLNLRTLEIRGGR